MNTQGRLLDLGLAAGATCLEVGPGTGSLLQWMIDRGVRVTVIDVLDRWFERFPTERVDARVGDVRTADLGGGHDLVIAQMVLHHLPERWAVVKRLANCLRPGGWFLVSDPDIRATWTMSGPGEVEDGMTAILRQAKVVGIDYQRGAQLPAAFRDAGLDDIDAGMWTPITAPGLGGLEMFV